MKKTLLTLDSNRSVIVGDRAMEFLRLFVFGDESMIAKHCQMTCNGEICPAVKFYINRCQSNKKFF
jgi:hypothetical protein